LIIKKQPIKTTTKQNKMSLTEEEIARVGGCRNMVRRHFIINEKLELFLEKMAEVKTHIKKSRTINQRTIDLTNDIMFGQSEIDDYNTSKNPIKKRIYEILEEKTKYKPFGDSAITTLYNNTKEMYEKFEKYEYRVDKYMEVITRKVENRPRTEEHDNQFIKLFDASLDDENEYIIGVGQEDPYITEEERDDPPLMYLDKKTIHLSMRNMIMLNLSLTQAVEKIETFTEIIEEAIQKEFEAREELGYSIDLEKSWTLTNDDKGEITEVDARDVKVNGITYMIDAKGTYYFDEGFNRVEEKDYVVVKNPCRNNYLYDNDITVGRYELERYRRSW
jgi:hypothetical protein